MAQSPNVTVWSGEPLSLGEGPTNHLRGSLVRFDINGCGVYERRFDSYTTRHIELPLMPSAAGRWTINPFSSRQRTISAPESRNRHARDCPRLSGRRGAARERRPCAPIGAFWIGTMSKDGNNKPGAIWRLFEGEPTADPGRHRSELHLSAPTPVHHGEIQATGRSGKWRRPGNRSMTGEPEPFVVSTTRPPASLTVP